MIYNNLLATRDPIFLLSAFIFLLGAMIVLIQPMLGLVLINCGAILCFTLITDLDTRTKEELSEFKNR